MIDKITGSVIQVGLPPNSLVQCSPPCLQVKFKFVNQNPKSKPPKSKTTLISLYPSHAYHS